MGSTIINDPLCRAAAHTPAGHQHYFGFHDVSPWAPDNSELALLRVPLGLRERPNSANTAEICLWLPGAGDPHPIGTTRAFNWQQGARVQWVPGGGKILMTNDLEEGRAVSRFYEAASGKWSRAIPAVYSIHPSGLYGLAPDWHRLAKFWRDYSYDLPVDAAPSCGERGDLRRIAFESGEEQMLVPIAKVRALCAQGELAEQSDFLSHATFSPQGTRFCFMYRRFTQDNALFSFFLVCNADGSDIRVLGREKCSHFDWLDEDRIVLWTRKLPGGAASLRGSGLTKRFPFKQVISLLRKLSPQMKQGLFSEMYYEVDYRSPGKMEPVASGVIEQDGHPMFTPDRKWMVTDTYVFEGKQPLILYSMGSGVRYNVAEFLAHRDFLEPSLKCDLHPRLDRAGRLIAVDSAHSGERQTYLVDIGGFLDAHPEG
jgi:hypothetical protein